MDGKKRSSNNKKRKHKTGKQCEVKRGFTIGELLPNESVMKLETIKKVVQR
jgi:hypothetical protein